MINQNWWFTTLLIKPHRYCPPLSKSIKCDVLIAGGGFSGISAAAEFLGKGRSVVLIEKNIVGGSSAGRSAGFLTPDSELELHQLVRRYGIDAAREIWEMPCRGIDRIVQAIKKNDIECGLLEQDSLFLGIGRSGKEAMASELECRQSVGFTDQQAYNEDELKSILGAENFTARGPPSGEMRSGLRVYRRRLVATNIGCKKRSPERRRMDRASGTLASECTLRIQRQEEICNIH